MSTLLAHCGTKKITRSELQGLPTPAGTRTHQPISHHQLIDVLIESLAFRHLTVMRDEYAVSPDGLKMFGVLDLELEEKDFRFSIGLRNANDKSMRLAMTAGYRVFVCDNMAFHGEFTPILYKHTRKLELLEIVALGVEKIQRGFEPLRRQIQCWQQTTLSDRQVKEIIYDAFLTQRLAPRHLLAVVHENYFQPIYEEFAPRTFWSLSNAFTSAFKAMKPVQQFRATARLGDFLQPYAEPRETPLRLLPSPRTAAALPLPTALPAAA
jgi:hypothetical protein